MSYEYPPDVAKYGGTSADQPGRILEQDRHPDNQVPIMVISAPGINREFPEKLTKMLLSGGGLNAVRNRFAPIFRDLDPFSENSAIQAVLQAIPEDFARWEREDHAIDAFGEYCSAKLFAAYSGREFVDAAEIIQLDVNGEVDLGRSGYSIRARFQPRQQYIVPGYYGRGPDGKIRTLGRGGSDTTGAIIARALQSPHYYNHTDEDGWRTGPPGIVKNGIVREQITYREGRELALGGCPIMSADSFKYLGGSGVETVICNTFGDHGNRGTVLTETRDWEDSPVASITGRDDLVGISLHRPGLDDQVGGTQYIFDRLRADGIPYHHLTTGTDDIAVLTVNEWDAGVAAIAEDLRQEPGNTVDLRRYGSVHIVGEGIADRRVLRRVVMARANTALARAGIEDYGDSNNGDSAGMTIFVDPELLRADINGNPLQITHKALEMFLQKQAMWRRITVGLRPYGRLP